MKKWLMIALVFIILATIVLSEEEPSVEFTSFECDDNGVLSFKSDYIWTGYKGGYMYLKSVKVNATKDDEIIKVYGYWRKFKDEDFSISEIKLNSPTAYFFSEEDSLGEGNYNIEIGYAISRNNLERFKRQFQGSVSCPKQKAVIEEVEVLPKIEEEEPREERPKTIPTKEPKLFDGESKDHTFYYVIGLLITLFVISVFLMKRLPKKPFHTETKPSSNNMKKLFEKKRK